MYNLKFLKPFSLTQSRDLLQNVVPTSTSFPSNLEFTPFFLHLYLIYYYLLFCVQLIYQIKILDIVLGMVINRCHMTSFFVPLSVVIVSHNTNPIQVLV